MILHGVPLIRSQSGTPVPASGLIAEIKQNPVCADVLFVNPPTWVIRNDSPDKTHASVTFAMIDEDGSITQRLIKHPPSLFGATTTAQKRTTLPAIAQCARCHMLGHSVTRCRVTRGSTICPLCGKGHRAQDHHVKCEKAPHHGSITCNCPPFCINCERAKKGNPRGHTALDARCPLRKAYKIPSNQTGNSSGEEEENIIRDITAFENNAAPAANQANQTAGPPQQEVPQPKAPQARVDDDDVVMVPRPTKPTNPLVTNLEEFTAFTGVDPSHPSFFQVFRDHWMLQHANNMAKATESHV